MPLCCIKKISADKLNRHVCIVFGLPSDLFSRDILSPRRFVQRDRRRPWKDSLEAEHFTLAGAIPVFGFIWIYLECFIF